jgi:hypothetical protein
MYPTPVPFVPKEYDVICVSRMHDLKNLPMIAAALKVYRQKYRPIRMVLIVGKAFDVITRWYSFQDASFPPTCLTSSCLGTWVLLY